jgi:beta-glucosidase
VAYVESVQEQGRGDRKHFAANNQEWMREMIDAHIDERTLHEIYLPAFEAAVLEGRSWAVMSAYNKLNGRWCSENRGLLHDLLKSTWGFRGLVVSDWGAVHSTVPTLDAGLDLEMPTGTFLNQRDLSAALESGAVSETAVETALDDAVRRLLRVLAWTGLLDRPAASGTDTPHQATSSVPHEGPREVPNHAPHRAIARTVARQSLVLLRNERSTLPLDRRRLKSLAVIGPNAAVARTGGGGLYVADRGDFPRGLQLAAGPGSASPMRGVTMAGDVDPIEPAALRSGAATDSAPGLRGEYFAIDLMARPPSSASLRR